MQSEGGAKLEAFHRCFSARIYRRLKAASRLVAIDGSAQVIEFARDKVAQFIGAKSQCRHSGTRSAQRNLKYAIKVPADSVRIRTNFVVGNLSAARMIRKSRRLSRGVIQSTRLNTRTARQSGSRRLPGLHLQTLVVLWLIALRQLPCGLRNNFVTSKGQTRYMTEIKTERADRTVAEKFMLWRRAYQT